METNVGHGGKWVCVCVCKCTVKGGWRTREQSGSMCPLCRRAPGEGDLCVCPESLTGRTQEEEEENQVRSALSGLGGLILVMNRQRKDMGAKPGVSSGRKKAAGMQGMYRGSYF